MEYTDMRNVNENPAFKVLAIQNSKLLEVRFNFTSKTIASCSFTLQNTCEHICSSFLVTVNGV